MTASRISQESSPPDKIPDSETDSPRDKEQDVPASPLEVPDGEGGAAIAPTATAASERPLHSIFGPGMKRFVIAMTIFAMLFSPVASFIYLPALTPIAEDYHRSVGEINLSVTLYQVMQAIAPLFFADLSDQIGRRPVYMITFTIFSAANIGLALQDSYPALLVLRALQSTGSSAVIAIGSAIVSDLVTSAERGSYVSVVQGSVQFAPAIAPILGGILTQYLGWRSVFWFLLIATAVFLLIYMPFVPETARRVVGNGSIPPPKLNSSLTSSQRRPYGKRKPEDIEAAAKSAAAEPKKKFKIPVPNIWAAVRIMFEKDVGLLLLFMALFVMANFAILIPLQDVIRRQYDFNDLQVGLCYIPFAIGAVIGAVSNGRLLDWNYARVARSIGVSPDRKRGDDMRRFPIEKARLDTLWPWLVLAAGTIIPWGWVVTAGTSLAAPLVVLFFAGMGVSGPVSILTTLLVDLYPMNPGRVSSTFNLTRATLSAVGTAVVQYIIDAWGYGYTYLFMGLLVVAASPCILIVRKWGPQWREERYLRFQKEKERQEAKEKAKEGKE